MNEALLAGFSLWPEGLATGQWWRLWTGHLVHVSPMHWWLNMVALGWLLSLRRGRSWIGLVWGFTLAAPALSLLLLLVRPDLSWYAGASGLLWMLGARSVVDWPTRQAGLAIGLMMMVLLLDLGRGGSALFADAFAVPEAHALGALLGWLAGLAQARWRIARMRFVIGIRKERAASTIRVSVTGREKKIVQPSIIKARRKLVSAMLPSTKPRMTGASG